MWPDGEAERRDTQSAADRPNNTQRIDVGNGDDPRGHGVLGHVSRFGKKWTNAKDMLITFGMTKGLSREEQFKDQWPRLHER